MKFTEIGDQSPDDQLTHYLTKRMEFIIALKEIQITLIKLNFNLLSIQHKLQAQEGNYQSNNKSKDQSNNQSSEKF